MKKAFRFTILVCMTIMLVMSYSSVTFGAKSVSHDDITPTVVDNGTTEASTVIEAVNPDNYENDDVKEIVKQEDITPAEIAEKLGQDSANVKTVDGLPVNLELYDRITDFYDIGVTDGGTIDFKDGKGKQVTIQADAVIGLKKSDFLILIINPDTGEMFLVSPDSFNSETGEMTLTLPSYGVFCIVEKVPIVVRDVHPEDYPSENVAASVSALDADSYLELEEWLNAFGIKEDTLEVADGVTVDVDDYNSANKVADVAVQLDEEDFNYQLNTKIWGNLYQDINECDWSRVLDKAGVKYDAGKLKKDPVALTEIEPFTLKDSFVYHVDAKTEEVSIAYEPEISFEICEDAGGEQKKIENRLNDTEDNGIQIKDDGDTSSIIDMLVPSVHAGSTQYTDEQKDIVTFDVGDIDEKNTENLCMVMSSDQYIGMGPFMLFMPKEKIFSWWWIILILILLLVVIYVVYRHRKGKDDKEPA